MKAKPKPKKRIRKAVKKKFEKRNLLIAALAAIATTLAAVFLGRKLKRK